MRFLVFLFLPIFSFSQSVDSLFIVQPADSCCNLDIKVLLDGEALTLEPVARETKTDTVQTWLLCESEDQIIIRKTKKVLYYEKLQKGFLVFENDSLAVPWDLYDKEYLTNTKGCYELPTIKLD